MSAKHTPGPYFREGLFIYATTQYTGDSAFMKKALKDGINRFFCQISGDNQSSCGGADDAELEAVACLFQAAPDLLEALKELFADYKELADSSIAGYWKLEDYPVGQKALAAIAKAEGGTIEN